MAAAVAALLVAGVLGLRSTASHQFVLPEPGYRLVVDGDSGLVSVQTAGAAPLTSFPLSMSTGSTPGPGASHAVVTRHGDTLEADTVSARGTVLQRAVLTASPQWFSVRFSLAWADAGQLSPRFFYDGRRGFDLSTITSGFSPDDPGSASRLPVLATAGRRALAPAPLDIELRTAGGWLGVGLSRVPNATELRLERTGALLMDYPLSVLRAIPDTGGGGVAGGEVRFPAFVVTLSPDTLTGLSVYHTALLSTGQASPGAPQPGWWRIPIVDTWGAQVAEHVARGSAGFTAAWVRSFVTDVRQRYGLSRFTLVIDSRWQQRLGDPTPDATRFGGVAGMRALIDELHAEGLRVVLWWPIWASANGFTGPASPVVASPAIDPTAPGFVPAMTETVDRLLGNGPADLDADGLKLDWTYNIPASVQNPSLGWGDAALYRYLRVIHTAAHEVRADALVEASAASPQFAAVTDSVRLYDAWSETAWDERAAVVAAADPGALIDGDGWQASPANTLLHTLSSAVYGVPALYYDAFWADGRAIPDATAQMIGRIAGLEALKQPGVAAPVAGGGWSYTAHGVEQARTFGSGTAAVFWTQGRHGVLTGQVITASGGDLSIPLPRRGAVTLLGPGGAHIRFTLRGTVVRAHLVAGETYTLTLR